jgi:ABC-type dipeptide/oligopeptide/nickel transport system ATPase component
MSDDKKPREFWVDTFALTAYDNKSRAEIDGYNIVAVTECESYSALEEKLRVANEFIETRGKHVIELADERDNLKEKLRVAVETLGFYSDKDIYEVYHHELSGSFDQDTRVTDDGGKRAREALAKLKGGEGES